ncbi:stage IV sporulation protein [Alkalihalophilus pseudofirmus OF4]|uniref:Stage IV sporulation protein n=1 Tax=Alkalihalophilus pseudofirmus (strain ATCC BAA-2126 / JCM 17055 / OF4) TaxID=398511 RepID=D3FY22_ALKPO|nr:sporulation protein YqfD [Alkalihalophilus pseudofirmus]ADC50781.1 stage IV sporulation protein [Alkalihalophilus pseudofirmus OF4]
MRNNWVQAWKGYVRVRVDGAYPERFLNRCIEERLSIWKIKRVGDERIVFYMDIEDAKKIRPLLRKTDCKVTFAERKGTPAVLRKVSLRAGFVAGLAACLAVIIVLSNMVWKVEVEGASPHVEHELRQVVAEMGIKPWTFQFSLPSVEQIQRDVTEQVSGATWVGVRQKGTTYQFEVVEQKLPEEAERVSPRHLVAKKKAIIHDIFVEHGQAQVKPNDFVEKGDMLVSGEIGKEGKTEIVAAVADIRGEIWYKSTASIPIERLFTTLTGESKNRHYLSMFNINIPFWGFRSHEFEQVQEFSEQKEFHFFKWTLPLKYTRKEFRETSSYNRTYTKEEAIEEAKRMARVELVSRLPQDAEIIGEKVLHEASENGKVKLKIHYQVLEDITSAQPIIQGD